MTRYELLPHIEAIVTDDVISAEALGLLKQKIEAHRQQRVIDGEGEALEPASILLDSAGIRLTYSGY